MTNYKAVDMTATKKVLGDHYEPLLKIVKDQLLAEDYGAVLPDNAITPQEHHNYVVSAEIFLYEMNFPELLPKLSHLVEKWVVLSEGGSVVFEAYDEETARQRMQPGEALVKETSCLVRDYWREWL